jgi:hypothetical protein
MTWYEFLLAIIGAGGIGGLIATIANVIQARRKSVSEQKESKIEQTKETVNLVDELLQKQLKWMSERMDQGETVRKQELEAIQQNLGQQLSNIQDENRKQNETIAAQNDRIGEQNDLLQDIKEYLNGGFAEFENRKAAQKKTATRKTKKA